MIFVKKSITIFQRIVFYFPPCEKQNSRRQFTKSSKMSPLSVQSATTENAQFLESTNDKKRLGVTNISSFLSVLSHNSPGNLSGLLEVKDTLINTLTHRRADSKLESRVQCDICWE